MIELKRSLSSVIYQLYTNTVLKCSLLAVSAYILTATFVTSPVVPALIAVLVLGFGLYLHRIYSDKKPQAIAIIHQTVGDTEYSLHLLDKPDPNIAEQLQMDRLNERISQVRMPNLTFSQVGLYALGLLGALAVHYAYPFLQSNPEPQKRVVSATSSVTRKEAPAVPAFVSAVLSVQPPAYTELPTTRSADLNASAISGSQLTWKLKFSNNEHLSVRLANSRGEELTFARPKSAGGDFEYGDRLISSGLYALKAYWTIRPGKDSLVYQSDFYRLEAKPDLAPRIEPDSKELYRYHYLKDNKNISVSARVSDDFKVKQSFIVATVARGSGENVKFREVRFPLNGSNYKESRLNKVIDLKALNFAPGDELYYYWAAVDNKQPEGNFSKSDTYFIVYKDTTKLEEADLATMAVNVMPEYFRSQRQIIIDTEKLIARRKKIAEKEFKSVSNEIGFDQKALRLRYGQYLGEEFENSIGGGHGGPPEGEGGLLDGYMHKHDSGEGEHETHEEHGHEEEHHHDHGDNQGGGDNQDPLAALMAEYVHSHDNGEMNTFYEQSTRSLLKMALEQMWQSELHLRLFEPEKALPFEHKALEYLKSAQQKARTFVKKSSQDPPPIKEKETRLTGELKNVNAAFKQERVYTQQQTEQLVGEVLGYLEEDQTLKSVQKLKVQQLSTALANQGTRSGLPSWSVLRTLQKMASGKTLSGEEREQLKTKLYRLAGASQRNGSTYTSERKLEQAFWRHLK